MFPAFKLAAEFREEIGFLELVHDGRTWSMSLRDPTKQLCQGRNSEVRSEHASRERLEEVGCLRLYIHQHASLKLKPWLCLGHHLAGGKRARVSVIVIPASHHIQALYRWKWHEK